MLGLAGNSELVDMLEMVDKPQMEGNPELVVECNPELVDNPSVEFHME